VSPEFPSDNPELWQIRTPNIALTLLRAYLKSKTEAEAETETETETEAAAAEAESEPEIVVEVVDFDDADFALVENENEPIQASTPEALPTEDVFQLFVRTLVEVALGAGAPARVVEALPGMLGATRLDVHALDASIIDALVAAGLLARTESGAVTRAESLVANAHAWRATLLGEETEFSVSSMLDEWSAHIVSRLASVPDQEQALRRELRERGIAAFGMLVAA
jgi:hypothetical protein